MKNNISSFRMSFHFCFQEKTDCESQVEEALVRLLVAQLSKDLPQNLSFQILNPNEVSY